MACGYATTPAPASDGVVHSVADLICTYFFSNGDGVSTCKELFPKGKSFGIEFFFLPWSLSMQCCISLAYEKPWQFTYFQEDSSGWDL